MRTSYVKGPPNGVSANGGWDGHGGHGFKHSKFGAWPARILFGRNSFRPLLTASIVKDNYDSKVDTLQHHFSMKFSADRLLDDTKEAS